MLLTPISSQPSKPTSRPELVELISFWIKEKYQDNAKINDIPWFGYVILVQTPITTNQDTIQLDWKWVAYIEEMNVYGITPKNEAGQLIAIKKHAGDPHLFDWLGFLIDRELKNP